ncbi:hypothetical protein ACFR9U_13745 [Halorientalis brevis]|uniref:Uncharacterized protein n=1 Tax=Halorientalis brevis TaxID=1126241 RepID=A0ABD6CFR3_9EURY
MTDEDSAANERQQAADDLFAVLQAIDAVDLNGLEPDDIRTLLDLREGVESLTRTYRTDGSQS